jgi:5'-3' exonuclease
MFFDGGHEQATKLYPEYKQNDRDRSEDFYEQCGAFESLVRCLGIPVFNVNGVEADDLIAVSSFDCAKRYNVVYIVSSDHDFFQLLRKKIKVFDDLHNRTITTSNFKDFYPGLKPIDLIGVKAIAGDASDNIKGIPNVGKGTALQVLEKIGGVKGLIKIVNGHKPFPSPEDFDSRTAWRIAKGFDDVQAARKIIRRNIKLVKLPTKKDQMIKKHRVQYEQQLMIPTEVDGKAAQEILRDFELSSILKQFKKWVKPIVAKRGRL